MELVSRMMDGSIPSPIAAVPWPLAASGPRISGDEKVSCLLRIPVLESCTTRQLRAVASITVVQNARAGEVLARTGQPGDRFFVIVDGAASIELSARRRRRIGPGEFFGEMSLLDGGPRSATVIADTAVRLLVIMRRDFRKLLRQVPDLTQRILITLSQRVRQAEQTIHT